MDHRPDKEVHLTYNTKDVSEIKLINNKVLCKRLTDNVHNKTNSGLYYPESMHENQRLGDNVDVVYEVAGVPDKLVVRPGFWKTEIEIEVGDIVWANRKDALHCMVVVDKGGIEYRLISYYSLIVAQREVHEFEWGHKSSYIIKDDLTYKVIPLNGYVLCSDIKSPASSTVITTNKILREEAKVEYVGKPNEYYMRGKKHIDLDGEISLKPKQRIHLDIPNKNKDIINRAYVEDSKFTRFNKDNMYFYIQRRSINAIL